MCEDDVIRELRAAREEYGRQFGFDLSAIVRDLREQERASGRQFVRLPPRKPTTTSRQGEPPETT